MKIDANYLRSLNYTEMNLKDVEIEMKPVDQILDEETKSCGLGIKGDKPFTEDALKQLCKFLRLPYAFIKQLRANANGHIVPYLHRQLTRTASSNVVFVSNDDAILSIAEEEDLHYRGKEAIAFDARLREAVDAKDSPLELSNVTFSPSEVTYGLRYKDPESIEHDPANDEGDAALRSLWKWGFTITHSALGLGKPAIGVELLRMVCANLTYMPAKTHTYDMPYEESFDEKWAHIATFLANPPVAQWLTLNNLIHRLRRTTASYREVAEARRRLMKLKVDKEDTETLERINAALHWKRIRKAYDIGAMEPPPSKQWYTKAGTPLSLFDVYNLVTRESTHAPSTVDVGLRQNLLIYGGSILTGTPDLFMQPPVIDWSSN
jgi:hypothetical protein